MVSVVAIIALAILYALLTWPLVHLIESRVPRPIAIIVVDAGITILVVAVAFLMAPQVYAQGQAAIVAFPQVSVEALAVIPPSLQKTLSDLFGQLDIGVATYGREALFAVFAVTRSLAGIIAGVIVIPILAAYFQLDSSRYANAILAVVPASRRKSTLVAMAEVSRVVGGFVRAQIVVSGLVGVLVYIVLAAAGVKFAFIIALTTAVFDLVPYLGGIVAFVPSLLFALAAGGVTRALIVCILLLAVFEFEAQVLAPQIVGARTGLAPSLVVIVLLIGGALFGAFGLFLAVPIAAGIGAAVKAFFAPTA